VHVGARLDWPDDSTNLAAVFRHTLAHVEVPQRQLVTQRNRLFCSRLQAGIIGKVPPDAVRPRLKINDRNTDVVSGVVHEKMNHLYPPAEQHIFTARCPAIYAWFPRTHHNAYDNSVRIAPLVFRAALLRVAIWMDMTPQLFASKITMPNLTIQVRNDAWTKNPEDAQKTFGMLGTKEKEMIWVENTTHRFRDGYNYFGRYPEKVFAFFDKYMKRAVDRKKSDLRGRAVA
jgi:hypothetical protein